MGNLEQLAKACLDVEQVIEEIKKAAEKVADEGSTFSRKALCEELGKRVGRLMCAQQHLYEIMKGLTHQ